MVGMGAPWAGRTGEGCSSETLHEDTRGRFPASALSFGRLRGAAASLEEGQKYSFRAFLHWEMLSQLLAGHCPYRACWCLQAHP